MTLFPSKLANSKICSNLRAQLKCWLKFSSLWTESAHQCMCTSILDGGDNKKGERQVEEQRCMYFFIKLLSSDSNMPLDKFFHQIQRTCLKAFGHIPIDWFWEVQYSDSSASPSSLESFLTFSEAWALAGLCGVYCVPVATSWSHLIHCTPPAAIYRDQIG